MKKKILLVDDEEKFCQMVKLNLEAAGKYEVRTETEGLNGMAAAEDFSPDLILLDIMMPNKDGLDLLAELKKNPTTASIPVVMLTAVDTSQSKIRAAGLQDDDYIVKPVTTQVLSKKIEAVLKRHK